MDTHAHGRTLISTRCAFDNRAKKAECGKHMATVQQRWIERERAREREIQHAKLKNLPILNSQ